MKNKYSKVIISLNDDAGVDQFSIVPKCEQGYWITSFPTFKEAVDFCDKNGYEHDGKYSDVRSTIFDKNNKDDLDSVLDEVEQCIKEGK